MLAIIALALLYAWLNVAASYLIMNREAKKLARSPCITPLLYIIHHSPCTKQGPESKPAVDRDTVPH